MQRHLLDPVGSSSVPRVVGRLCGVQGARRVVCRARGPRSAPEVAARLDRPRPVPGTPGQDLGHAGHAPPAHTRGGRNFLSLMAFGRSWEKPSWQRYFGVSDYETGGQASPRRPRGARRDGPHPGGTGGGGRRKARAWACRPSAPLRLGWRSPPSRLLESCGVVHPQRDRVGQGQMPQLLRTIHLRKHPRAARRCRQ
jgi:hypothetical protein